MNYLARAAAGRWFFPRPWLCCGSGAQTGPGSSGPSWAGGGAAESCGSGCAAIQQQYDVTLILLQDNLISAATYGGDVPHLNSSSVSNCHYLLI